MLHKGKRKKIKGEGNRGGQEELKYKYLWKRLEENITRRKETKMNLHISKFKSVLPIVLVITKWRNNQNKIIK